MRSAPALAAATERVCIKLRDELTGLIGGGGVRALAGRALSLAQRGHPRLTKVEIGSATCFEGLAAALEGSSADEVEAAGTAMIENFLGLLVSLMGEDLALRPVHKLWPAAIHGDAAPDFDERDK